jgi:hypothetical protein
MSRRYRDLLLAAITTTLLVAFGISVKAARAQEEITAQVPPADFSFGQHITFHLQATAPFDISAVNLFFRVQGETDTTVVPISVEPDRQIRVDYPYSLVRHYVPPFATITYWWALYDGDGVQWPIEERVVYYADNRYNWQSLPDQHQGISWEVYWVQGDVVFGQEALNTARKAIEEIYQELRIPVPGVIRLFIYPGERDLRSALNLAGYDWAGGQARPELGAILVGIPDTLTARIEMERLIPHELTHLMVYEAAGRVARRVPSWLNEGLATLNERAPDPERQALVEQALERDELLPLGSLCAPFPVDEQAARLAYAESASVVQYLREKYGSQIIRDLLAAYADGASCEAGVERVLGKSLNGLESAWRAYVTRQGQLSVVLDDSAVWLALWFLTALLTLPLVGIVRGGNRQAL